MTTKKLKFSIPALDNPKTMAEFDAGVHARQEADYGCYMALAALLKCFDRTALRMAVEGQGFTSSEADLRVEDVFHAVNHRQEINEKVMRLLVHQPETRSKGGTCCGGVHLDPGDKCRHCANIMD